MPATRESLAALTDLMRNRSNLALAVHFHVYNENELLLAWYDAFTDDPMRLSGSIAEQQVRALATALGTSFTREPNE